MHILLETPIGYALFRTKPLELEYIRRFKDSNEGVESVKKSCTGELPKGILEVLEGRTIKTLGLTERRLGESIKKEKTKIKIREGEEVEVIIKEIHKRLPELLNISEKELERSSLLLAHAICREKLKMTGQQNDLIIVQSIKVIDKLDKDINNKCMRIREWYGMHCPEIGELVPDNYKYVEIVKAHTEAEENKIPEGVKHILEKSLGGEITEEDKQLISESAKTVLDMFTARERLHEHLYNRMATIAPNILELLGSLLGARIISHAGSLSELSRKPASTIQVMGAEKALFKAMKEKKSTPKYGIIYNSTYVGQVPAEIKGQVARTLAAKIAIASRCDLSGEEDKGDYGVKAREEVEKRIKVLTQKKNNTQKKVQTQQSKFIMKRPASSQESFKRSASSQESSKRQKTDK